MNLALQLFIALLLVIPAAALVRRELRRRRALKAGLSLQKAVLAQCNHVLNSDVFSQADREAARGLAIIAMNDELLYQFGRNSERLKGALGVGPARQHHHVLDTAYRNAAFAAMLYHPRLGPSLVKALAQAEHAEKAAEAAKATEKAAVQAVKQLPKVDRKKAKSKESEIRWLIERESENFAHCAVA